MSAIGLLLALVVGGTLGFFGGGGSILTVPLFVYGFGLDAKPAMASSLLVVAAASAAAVVAHARAGRVHWRTGLTFASGGMLGAYAGGRAAAWIDSGVLLLLFAGLMALTSWAMWRGRSVAPPAGDPGDVAGVRLALQGLAVGTLTGLVGAGGGFLIVPALVLWAGLPVPAAVATSLLVIVLQSLAGYSGYAAHVDVAPALVASVAALTVAGALLGSALAHSVSPEAVRRGFAVLVAAMSALILLRQAPLVAAATGDALPHTLPQLLFAVLMLAIGVLAGRSSRTPGFGRDPQSFEDGAGI